MLWTSYGMIARCNEKLAPPPLLNICLCFLCLALALAAFGVSVSSLNQTPPDQHLDVRSQLCAAFDGILWIIDLLYFFWLLFGYYLWGPGGRIPDHFSQFNNDSQRIIAASRLELGFIQAHYRGLPLLSYEDVLLPPIQLPITPPIPPQPRPSQSEAPLRPLHQPVLSSKCS